MNLKQRLENAGATPAKLALIGVLSLVLVGVIVAQLPDEPTTHVAQTPSEPKPAKTNSTETENLDKQEKKKELLPWPKSDLAATLASNPFAQPSWARVEKVVDQTSTLATAEISEDLADLQEKGASIVVIGDGRKLAKIGDQRLYVGDILEGYRVSDITPQGVLLDKLKP